MPRPFLKWAGGKFRLLPRILAVLPPGERLVEPFAGSAALYLNSHFPAALICDCNPDIITLYRTLQREGEEFIRYCRSLFTPESNCRASFLALRSEFNAARDEARRAALFLYLNRHSFNGLTRYNSSGNYNVPFGRHARPYFPLLEMRAFHQKATQCHSSFVVSDFRETFARARPGDVFYCDPPYMPLSATAAFTAYTGQRFDEREHETLAGYARAAAAQGVPVLLSNHDTRQSRALYKGARLSSFTVRRLISCKGNERAAVPELLALFPGPGAKATPSGRKKAPCGKGKA